MIKKGYVSEPRPGFRKTTPLRRTSAFGSRQRLPLRPAAAARQEQQFKSWGWTHGQRGRDYRVGCSLC
ncbi:hypothetical protein E2C01_000853 [Portunus trituberculatus]|uniref:Uncharacterized protein n=1 Tax=Portunus trituberculatus TaxID=210409 RepID=A0A5B7CF81_PORTR|nr:hypothetical protein [Portunus trituberculatus]